MLTLALDTSTREGSVALGQDGEVLVEATLSVRATHSETVLPAIDALLRQEGRSPGDVERVVVGAGPGSFTGVRIAAALARGFCFPGGSPLLAYSSLAAVAAASGLDEGPVCGLLDARRGQVYAAGYRFDEGFGELFPPLGADLRAVLARLPGGDWTVAGDISAEQAEIVAAADLPFVPSRPAASALLRLAWMAPAAGTVPEPASWEPAYVRASSAERRPEDA